MIITRSGHLSAIRFTDFVSVPADPSDNRWVFSIVRETPTQWNQLFGQSQFKQQLVLKTSKLKVELSA